MPSIRQGWLILALGGLLSFLTTVVTPSDETSLLIAAVIAPVIMGLAALSALFVIFRENALNIFQPIGAFAVATLVYFGFGGLVPLFADAATLGNMKETYDFNTADIVAVHGVVGVGICTLALVVFLVLRQNKSGTLIAGEFIDVPYFRRAVFLFFVVGMFVQTTLTLPSQLDLIPAPPAAVAQLGRLLTFSLLLMGFGLARGILDRRIFVPAYASAVIVMVGGGVISFSKHEILFQAGAAFGGFILANSSRRTVGIMAAVVGATFVIITPLILIARQLGDTGDSSISSRLDATKATIEIGADVLDAEDTPNLVLVRLQYVNTMTWAMNEFNSGRPGTSVTKDVMWLFVPRIIWPLKPVLSQTGYEINELVTEARIYNSVGLTIFGEAYWNGGYEELILVCAFVGLIIGWVSGWSFGALARMDVAGTIVVYTGALLGFRIDGYLKNDYLGQIIIMVLTFLLLRFILAVATMDMKSEPLPTVDA